MSQILFRLGLHLAWTCELAARAAGESGEAIEGAWLEDGEGGIARGRSFQFLVGGGSSGARTEAISRQT